MTLRRSILVGITSTALARPALCRFVGGGAAPNQVSIGSNSRTFPTPEAWIASMSGMTIPYDPSNPQPMIGHMWNDSLFTTAGIVFSGINTSAWTGSGLPAIILTTAVGQSFRDNPSVRSNALTYNPAHGVAISCPLASLNGRAITADIPNIKISNLQIQCSDGNRVLNTDDAGGSPPIFLDSCIIQGNTQSNWVCAVGSVATNCLFEQTSNIPSSAGSGMIFDGAISNAGSTFIYCTLVQYSDTAPSDQTIWNTAGEGGHFPTITNTGLFGSTLVTNGGMSVTATNCFTDSSTLPPGVTHAPYAGQFLGTSSSAPDWRLTDGSALRATGTPIAGVTTDISGFPRNPTTPCVGCWEHG